MHWYGCRTCTWWWWNRSLVCIQSSLSVNILVLTCGHKLPEKINSKSTGGRNVWICDNERSLRNSGEPWSRASAHAGIQGSAPERKFVRGDGQRKGFIIPSRYIIDVPDAVPKQRVEGSVRVWLDQKEPNYSVWKRWNRGIALRFTDRQWGPKNMNETMKPVLGSQIRAEVTGEEKTAGCHARQICEKLHKWLKAKVLSRLLGFVHVLWAEVCQTRTCSSTLTLL